MRKPRRTLAALARELGIPEKKLRDLVRGAGYRKA
jgi:hypothetical protein